HTSGALLLDGHHSLPESNPVSSSASEARILESRRPSEEERNVTLLDSLPTTDLGGSDSDDEAGVEPFTVPNNVQSFSGNMIGDEDDDEWIFLDPHEESDSKLLKPFLKG